MSRNYPVPGATLERELEVKKSRFIARAGPAASRDAALAFVAEARARYPDARHHCWAYLAGDPATAASAAMNDDGEPSGTAGKPILSVIRHKGLGDVVVVVTRYFGGVKLGAGGLVRAYAGATEAVLSELPVVRHEARRRLRLALDFAQEQPLRHWAGEREARLVEVGYAEQVRAVLDLRDADMPALEAFCAARGIHWQDA